MGKRKKKTKTKPHTQKNTKKEKKTTKNTPLLIVTSEVMWDCAGKGHILERITCDREKSWESSGRKFRYKWTPVHILSLKYLGNIKITVLFFFS